MPDFDVVELPPADHVEPGERAPDFTRPLVTAEYWEDVSLSDLTDEGPVLVVFYPMNGGGKSIYTWNEIRDREWTEFDATVVGVGIGHPFDNARFVEERGIDHGLFADPANGVAEAYGVVHDLDGMAGVEEPRPAVFLVDEDRTVTYAWVAEEWPQRPPFDEIERELRRA
ncbi:MAG: redoxin domain-containing protein [Haloferacaceae archaeon]